MRDCTGHRGLCRRKYEISLSSHLQWRLKEKWQHWQEAEGLNAQRHVVLESRQMTFPRSSFTK